MKIEQTISQILSIQTKSDKAYSLVLTLHTEEATLQELQKGFDGTLRTNVMTRDSLKGEILSVLYNRIKQKSQTPEYTNPKTGMKIKVKDLTSFISELKDSQYEGVGRYLEGKMNEMC